MPPRFKKYKNYVYRLRKWLARQPLAWCAGLVVIAAPIIAFCINCEAAFRWIGLFLQLLGILTVVVKIRGTETRFNYPTVAARFLQWLREWPRIKSPPQVISGEGLSVTATLGTMRVDVWSNIDSDAAPGARLDAVEKNLNRLRGRFKEFEREAQQGLQRQVHAFEEEKQARAGDYNKLREKLKAAQTEGLHVDLAGVVWLAEGLIMSTIPSELAYLSGLFR